MRDLRGAACRRCQLEPPVVEHVEGDVVAAADLAQDVRGWHRHVREYDRRRRRSVQAELVFLFAVRDAAKRAFDEEGRELLAIGFREDDEQIREGPVGDPQLLAREPPRPVGLLHGARPRGERVRSGSGFAEAVGADEFARQQARQIASSLFRRAESEQRQDGQPGLGAESHRKRTLCAKAFGHDDAGGLVEPDAAFRLGHVGTDESKRARPARSGGGRPASPCARGPEGRRLDLVGDELRGGLRDQPMIVAEAFGRQHAGRRRWRRRARTGPSCEVAQQVLEGFAHFRRASLEEVRGAVNDRDLLWIQAAWRRTPTDPGSGRAHRGCPGPETWVWPTRACWGTRSLRA